MIQNTLRRSAQGQTAEISYGDRLDNGDNIIEHLFPTRRVVVNRITWPPCDVCGRSVIGANGRLLLREVEVTSYLDNRINEDNTRDRPSQHEVAPKSGKSAATDPASDGHGIPWHWGHEECLPDSRYCIVAGEFENIMMLLSETFHPWEDELIDWTNWPETVRRLTRAAAA